MVAEQLSLGSSRKLTLQDLARCRAVAATWLNLEGTASLFSQTTSAKFEVFVFEGLEVDFAAHAAVKNEDGVLKLKAPAKDFDGASQRGGIGAVASQGGDVADDAGAGLLSSTPVPFYG